MGLLSDLFYEQEACSVHLTEYSTLVWLNPLSERGLVLTWGSKAHLSVFLLIFCVEGLSSLFSEELARADR